MFKRVAGALIRAAMVAAIILLPVLLLPELSPNLIELAFLASMIAAAFVIFEYGSITPTFIEFRFSAPYNRLRFLLFALLITSLGVALRDPITSTTSAVIVSSLANSCATFWDFTGSPLAFFENLIHDLDAEGQHLIITTAAIGLSITSIAIALAGTLICIFAWPLMGYSTPNFLSQTSHMTDQPFNIWANVPSFDRGLDEKTRRCLRQSGIVSLFLGVSLLFLIPQAAYALIGPLKPVSNDNSLLLLWMIAIWCFVPALSILRGVALYKISNLIGQQMLNMARG